MVTSGEKGNIGVGDSEVQATMYKRNMLQGYIEQHREHSQYFITINRVESIKILNNYFTPETNNVNQLYLNKKVLLLLSEHLCAKRSTTHLDYIGEVDRQSLWESPFINRCKLSPISLSQTLKWTLDKKSLTRNAITLKNRHQKC